MKATTKLRLYEIKRKILKPFSEVRRVVSQFFETEYFYRWKKTTYPWWDDDGNYAPSTTRNLWYLNNTWDGNGPIFGILDAKLFHIYINYRNYGISPDRYLYTKDVSEFGTEDEKNWAFDKLIKYRLEQELTDDYNYNMKKHSKKYYAKKASIVLCKVDDSASADGVAEYRITRYIHKDKTISFETYRLEKVILRDTGKTTTATDVVQFCKTGKDVKVEKPYYTSETITIIDMGITPDWKKVQDYFNKQKIDVDIKERALIEDNYGQSTIIIEPHELPLISDSLKEHFHGKVVGLHKVYTLRKNLLKLSDMDIILTEPYKTEYEKIGLLDSQVKKDKAWTKLNEQFKDDQKKLSAEIMESILDCGDWTD